MLWSYCAFLSEFIFIQFSGEFSSRDDSCISCSLSFLASAAVARGEGDSVGAGGGEGGADGGGASAALDGDRAGKLVHLIFGQFFIVACFRRGLAAGACCCAPWGPAARWAGGAASHIECSMPMRTCCALFLGNQYCCSGLGSDNSSRTWQCGSELKTE